MTLCHWTSRLPEQYEREAIVRSRLEFLAPKPTDVNGFSVVTHSVDPGFPDFTLDVAALEIKIFFGAEVEVIK